MGALAIDSSSPAAVVQTNIAGPITTASFQPPTNALLVIAAALDSTPNSTPPVPTITDNLGTHLTYALSNWQSRADIDPIARDGQAAIWTAPVASSAPMTITVAGRDATYNDGALMVWVITDSGGGLPTVGAAGKLAGQGISAIAQSYTAAATGGWGFLVDQVYVNHGPQTAGTGTTVDSSGNVGTNFSYAFARRTTADDVNSVANTLNVTLAGTESDVCWCYVEILPAAGVVGVGITQASAGKPFSAWSADQAYVGWSGGPISVEWSV